MSAPALTDKAGSPKQRAAGVASDDGAEMPPAAYRLLDLKLQYAHLTEVLLDTSARVDAELAQVSRMTAAADDEAVRGVQAGGGASQAACQAPVKLAASRRSSSTGESLRTEVLQQVSRTSFSARLPRSGRAIVSYSALLHKTIDLRPC